MPKRARWCREKTAACGGSNERERVEVYLYGPCRRTFVNHDVDTVVLHGGVEVLLDDGTQTVYLIDEEDIVGFQRRENTGQIAGLVQYRTARNLEAYAKLVGNDVAKSGLSQSWRTVQKGVVEGLSPVFRRLHEDTEVLHDILLSAEVVELQRTKSLFELLLRRTDVLIPYIEIVIHNSPLLL